MYWQHSRPPIRFGRVSVQASESDTGTRPQAPREILEVVEQRAAYVELHRLVDLDGLLVGRLAHHLAQLGRHVGGARVALLRLLRQRAGEDAIEGVRQRRVDVAHRRVRLDGDAVHDGERRGVGVALEGVAPGEHLVEHHAEREDVRAPVDRPMMPEPAAGFGPERRSAISFNKAGDTSLRLTDS